MLSVSRAPWSGWVSRWGARLTLSVFSLRRVDPTLRRLRAPLSGATLRFAAMRLWALRAGWASRCGHFAAGGVAVRLLQEAALHWARASSRWGHLAAGGVAGEAARGGSPTWAAGAMRVAVRAVRAGSADAPPALNGIWRLNI